MQTPRDNSLACEIGHHTLKQGELLGSEWLIWLIGGREMGRDAFEPQMGVPMNALRQGYRIIWARAVAPQSRIDLDMERDGYRKSCRFALH